ncbi:Protein of unknown function [Cyclobacterium xiamenense]|uniref:DUF3179 domain-containing protein n=1 Tax=Cyclobacterium xiamenense TaxID=1297121 RepID=A0A1H6WAF8_9BACT|nr:DUF3179 domain-containing protein [Cyclobacterium xiamenense]SEJ11037.1 Protein of unknown function [Cyclobacterium xiamenense]
MKNVPTIGMIVFLWVVSFGCGEPEGPDFRPGGGGGSPGGNQNWLIPEAEVFDGGPGKDGIPALNEPLFVDADEIDYLSDEDLVLGYAVDGQAKAYPHKILDWHEIINDEVANTSLAVIYCPLTGTGIGWDREVSAGKTTFGVSGLLYNTNVIPYDRLTDSNWSQMRFEAVNGDLIGEKPEVISLIETSWSTWKEIYPDTRVVSRETGHNRNYSNYPYGDYKTNHSSLLFPVSKSDNRLPAKERVLGIMKGANAKVYPLNRFAGETQLIADNFQGSPIVVIGSKDANILVALNRELPDGTELELVLAGEANNPWLLKDQEGNRWNLFGKAVSGPREGESLEAIPQMMGFWFSWPPFFEGIEIYE